MKIKSTPEIVEFLNETKNNIIERASFSDSIDEFIYKVISKQDEKKILDMYASYGDKRDSLMYDYREITDNPYYKNVKLDNIDFNGIRYKNKVLKARQVLHMSYSKRLNNALKYTHDIGYVDKNVNIPRLVEDNHIWMSPTIAEQRSMKDDIDKAYGSVLTFGLGIGYYPYMVLLKDNVKKVTIVEFNESVIELFKKNILPQFNTDKEVEIIHGDMYDYYNEEFLSKFDYIFVDVWLNNIDGLDHYRKLMQTGVRKDNIGFWIEESIVEPIRMLIALYLKSLLDGDFMSLMNRFNGEDYSDMKLIHKYFRKIDKEVSDVNELIYYINNTEVIKAIFSA